MCSATEPHTDDVTNPFRAVCSSFCGQVYSQSHGSNIWHSRSNPPKSLFPLYDNGAVKYRGPTVGENVTGAITVEQIPDGAVGTHC